LPCHARHRLVFHGGGGGCSVKEAVTQSWLAHSSGFRLMRRLCVGAGKREKTLYRGCLEWSLQFLPFFSEGRGGNKTNPCYYNEFEVATAVDLQDRSSPITHIMKFLPAFVNASHLLMPYSVTGIRACFACAVLPTFVGTID
jgi:hypothetical protein